MEVFQVQDGGHVEPAPPRGTWFLHGRITPAWVLFVLLALWATMEMRTLTYACYVDRRPTLGKLGSLIYARLN